MFMPLKKNAPQNMPSGVSHSACAPENSTDGTTRPSIAAHSIMPAAAPDSASSTAGGIFSNRKPITAPTRLQSAMPAAVIST